MTLHEQWEALRAGHSLPGPHSDRLAMLLDHLEARIQALENEKEKAKLAAITC